MVVDRNVCNGYTAGMSDVFTIPRIAPVEQTLVPSARRIWDSKAKPQLSLGRLEDLAVKIACIRNELNPVLERPMLLLAAADHGVVAQGVTGSPQEITMQQCINFSRGGGAIGLMCAGNGIDLEVVDVGVAADFDPHEQIMDRKIARGTADMTTGPAMTASECHQALAVGTERVSTYARSGKNVVAFGEMGVGNTTAASALMASYTGCPVSLCTGQGSGMDAAGLAHKRAVVDRALRLHHGQSDPIEVLRRLGGLEIACIAGGMLEAASRRMVVLVDGFICTAALLAASRMEPAVLDYVVFCHESREAGHRLLIELLGGSPLLRLGMCLGEGTGAALGWLVVRQAVDLYNTMTSFERGGVTDSVSLLKARGIDRAAIH